MTAFLETDGTACDVNPVEVSALRTAPAAFLPPGLPAATIVQMESAPDLIVQGTVAAVAAALALPTGAGGSVQFVFRPTAPDSPATGVFGSWASLVAATAALAAAGAPFEIFVDLALLGASFLVSTITNFGGQCTLRGLPGSAFNLQVQTPANTLTGVSAVEDLSIEATGAAAGGALLLPAGLSVLTLRGLARLLSSNANPAGPVVDVAAGDQLILRLDNGARLSLGASAAVLCAGAGSTLAVIVGESSEVAAGSISGGAPGVMTLVKNALNAKLPTTLAAFVGYNAGGVTNAVVPLQVPGAVLHGGQFGALALPVAAGAYFLPNGGNAAIALAAVGDSPLVEPQNGSTPRLLVGALISADVDGTDGVNPSTVEVLVNGVLVPGMTSSVATLMNLASAPIQLTPTQGALVLAPLDVVSVRFTLGAAGIVLSPVNPRAVLLAG